jgi:hypothetical protein
LNRLIHPLVNLSGEKGLDEFFELGTELVEKTKFLGESASSSSLMLGDEY